MLLSSCFFVATGWFGLQAVFKNTFKGIMVLLNEPHISYKGIKTALITSYCLHNKKADMNFFVIIKITNKYAGLYQMLELQDVRSTKKIKF